MIKFNLELEQLQMKLNCLSTIQTSLVSFQSLQMLAELSQMDK